MNRTVQMKLVSPITNAGESCPSQIMFVPLGIRLRFGSGFSCHPCCQSKCGLREVVDSGLQILIREIHRCQFQGDRSVTFGNSKNVVHVVHVVPVGIHVLDFCVNRVTFTLDTWTATSQTNTQECSNTQNNNLFPHEMSLSAMGGGGPYRGPHRAGRCCCSPSVRYPNLCHARGVWLGIQGGFRSPLRS